MLSASALAPAASGAGAKKDSDGDRFSYNRGMNPALQPAFLEKREKSFDSAA